MQIKRKLKGFVCPRCGEDGFFDFIALKKHMESAHKMTLDKGKPWKRPMEAERWYPEKAYEINADGTYNARNYETPSATKECAFCGLSEEDGAELVRVVLQLDENEEMLERHHDVGSFKDPNSLQLTHWACMWHHRIVHQNLQYASKTQATGISKKVAEVSKEIGGLRKLIRSSSMPDEKANQLLTPKDRFDYLTRRMISRDAKLGHQIDALNERLFRSKFNTYANLLISIKSMKEMCKRMVSCMPLNNRNVARLSIEPALRDLKHQKDDLLVEMEAIQKILKEWY